MMKKLLPIFFYLFLFSTLITIFPKETHAYIDPGSGSYLTQIILGFVFGGLFMLKVYWNKIKNVFFKNRAKKDNQEKSEDK